MMSTPFTFDHKYRVFEHDVLDLSIINAVVPSPDADVDLDVALTEMKRDLINVRDTYLLGGRLSIESNWRIPLNHRDWSLFWSVRSPNPVVRVLEKQALNELNASIERITAKAKECLQRRLQQGTQS
jgi:hypothetical protein